MLIDNREFSNRADEALKSTLRKFLAKDLIRQESRNGPVLRHIGPLVTVYGPDYIPVITSPIRDANPFFHLVESMYFLAGRDDLETLEFFNSQYGKYSDDGVTLHGSYGYRWINNFDFDQIPPVIEELKTNPDSRRCVIQMWDSNRDLPMLSKGGKDTPCNTQLVFDPMPDGTLNMHVFNRSNDLIYGATGANQVHFNVFHSYICALLNRPKGNYYQVSSNTHLYLEFPITAKMVDFAGGRVIYRSEFLQEPQRVWSEQQVVNYRNMFKPNWNPLVSLDQNEKQAEETLHHEQTAEFLSHYLYDYITIARSKTTSDLDDLLRNLEDLANIERTPSGIDEPQPMVSTPVFKELHTMCTAWMLYKKNFIQQARDSLTGSESPWAIAGQEWLDRRIKARLEKANG